MPVFKAQGPSLMQCISGADVEMEMVTRHMKEMN